MSHLGRRLREERERLGLTQEQFAAIGGIKKRAQVRYESGDRAPDAGYLLRLAASEDPQVDIQYVLSGVRWGAMGPQDAELLRLPPAHRAQRAFAMLLDALDALPLDDRNAVNNRAAQALLGYIVEHAPTQESLNSFVGAAVRLWRGSQEARVALAEERAPYGSEDERELLELYRALAPDARRELRASLREQTQKKGAR